MKCVDSTMKLNLHLEITPTNIPIALLRTKTKPVDRKIEWPTKAQSNDF